MWIRFLRCSGLGLLLLGSTVLFAGDPPFAPPSSSDRCAVCGMLVAPYPEWVASVQFEGAAPFYFDGPRDMFTYLFARAPYHSNGALPVITGVFVTEYYTRRGVAAGQVFFVAGSDVLGPMGQELVPVAGRENLRVFLSDHGGERVMVFDGAQLQEAAIDP